MPMENALMRKTREIESRWGVLAESSDRRMKGNDRTYSRIFIKGGKKKPNWAGGSWDYPEEKNQEEKDFRAAGNAGRQGEFAGGGREGKTKEGKKLELLLLNGFIEKSKGETTGGAHRLKGGKNSAKRKVGENARRP